MSSAEPVELAKKLIISSIKGTEDSPKRTDFHKIIYRLQETMEREDLENKLGGKVPYYWYEQGPYSEVVEQARNELLESGEIEEDKSQGGVEIYRIGTVKSENEVDDTVKMTLESICNNYNFYAINQEIEEIYEEFAPVKFQKYYKFSFLPYLEETVNHIESSQSNLADHLEMSDARYSNLRRRLIKSQACLPRDEEYREFSALFGRFFDAAKLHIKMLEADEEIESARTLQNLSIDMWELFAQFIRIAHHDEYYDKRVESWKEVRDNTLEGKKAQVEHYESLIYTEDNSVLKKEHKSDSDSAWASVAKGIVDNAR
jgi:hypothetical protein